MARVVRFHQTGGPEVLQIEEIEVGAPGRGELRLRIEAVGLNRAEALFRQGKYLTHPSLPARLGYEASGIVDAVGDGVDGFARGDAVCVIPAFSMNNYAVCAEQAVVPASAVMHRPPALTAVQAAAVPMQYVTAYGALNEIAGMGLGDAVIIPAASSSVGLAAIQLANAAGAMPIAVTRTSAKRQALMQAGAAHVVASAEQDLAGEVRRITNRRGARIAFDPVVGSGLSAIAEAMAQNGIIIFYGGLSGEPTPLPFASALTKALTLRGYLLFEITSDPKRLGRAWRAICHGLEAGRLSPVIAQTFPLNEVAEAYRHMEANTHVGKIVVTVT
jgi:NADPH:quinone reductase-like Zn-dependent oxidoreductase